LKHGIAHQRLSVRVLARLIRDTPKSRWRRARQARARSDTRSPATPGKKRCGMIVAIVLSDHFRREPYPSTGGAACGGGARRKTGAFARTGQ
jgi:hypothetical protein